MRALGERGARPRPGHDRAALAPRSAARRSDGRVSCRDATEARSAYFGAPQVGLSLAGDLELAETILEETRCPRRARWPLDGLAGRDRGARPRGHGARCISSCGGLERPVPTGARCPSRFWTLQEHVRFGEAIAAAIDAESAPDRSTWPAATSATVSLPKRPAGYDPLGRGVRPGWWPNVRAGDWRGHADHPTRAAAGGRGVRLPLAGGAARACVQAVERAGIGPGTACSRTKGPSAWGTWSGRWRSSAGQAQAPAATGRRPIETDGRPRAEFP